MLSNPLEETFMYHGNRDDDMDVITKEDCAYAFVRGINYATVLNKQTFNLKTDTINYGKLLDKLLLINGLSSKYLLSRIFLEKDYYSPICSDSDELDNIIHYKNDSLNEYFKRLKSKNKGHKFAKFLAKKMVGKNK